MTAIQVSRSFLATAALALAVGLPAFAAPPAPLGAEDLVFSLQGIDIDIPSAYQSDVSDIPGGEWDADETGELYVWPTGGAHFSNGKIDQIYAEYSLDKGNAEYNVASTSRGIAFGSKESDIRVKYPKPTKTWTEEGVSYYLFTFDNEGYPANLVIGATKLPKASVATVTRIGFMLEYPEPEEKGEMSFSYIDGFTWGTLQQAEKYRICERIAEAFAERKVRTFVGKESDMLEALDTAYTGGHPDFQDSPVRILARNYKVKNQAVIDEIAAQ